jgi:YVTN family beta-propeller protein
MALFAIMLTMGLALAAFPAEAAHFAYIANGNDNTVSVIDTATNTVVGAPLAVGFGPIAVAVASDGKHAYVANTFSNNVSVIDTATNTVEAATLAVGVGPFAVAVTPDGAHAVANFGWTTPTEFAHIPPDVKDDVARVYVFFDVSEQLGIESGCSRFEVT